MEKKRGDPDYTRSPRKCKRILTGYFASSSFGVVTVDPVLSSLLDVVDAAADVRAAAAAAAPAAGFDFFPRSVRVAPIPNSATPAIISNAFNIFDPPFS